MWLLCECVTTLLRASVVSAMVSCILSRVLVKWGAYLCFIKSIELVLLNGDNDYAYCSDFWVYCTRRSAMFSKLGLCSAECNRHRPQSLCAWRVKIRGVFSSRQPLWCSSERWLCQFYKHFLLKVVYLDWWLYTGTDSFFAMSTKRNI